MSGHHFTFTATDGATCAAGIGGGEVCGAPRDAAVHNTDDVAMLVDALNARTAERDEVRAEVERLTQAVDQYRTTAMRLIFERENATSRIASLRQGLLDLCDQYRHGGLLLETWVPALGVHALLDEAKSTETRS